MGNSVGAVDAELLTNQFRLAGENAAYAQLPQAMNDKLISVFSKFGAEEKYDFLDDETGKFKANEADLMNALNEEKELASSDNNYSPKILSEQLTDQGPCVYCYDSNGDGKYETNISFDNGGYIHSASDDNKNAVYIVTENFGDEGYWENNLSNSDDYEYMNFMYSMSDKSKAVSYVKNSSENKEYYLRYSDGKLDDINEKNLEFYQ